MPGAHKVGAAIPAPELQAESYRHVFFSDFVGVSVAIAFGRDVAEVRLDSAKAFDENFFPRATQEGRKIRHAVRPMIFHQGHRTMNESLAPIRERARGRDQTKDFAQYSEKSSRQ